MIGILSYGAYIPRLRLSRKSIYQAMGWFSPMLIMGAKGERTMANWDEDTITMGVEAARGALEGCDKKDIQGLFMASTTFPFQDRQNSTIVATALNLSQDISTQDISGSQRAGTNALLTALEMCEKDQKGPYLVVASDMRKARTGSIYQMYFGDGASALIVGEGEKVIARYMGSYSISLDFNDHIRSTNHKYDFFWEERWARDEGYLKIIPSVIKGLLSKLNLSPTDITTFIYPCLFKKEHKRIASIIEAREDQIADPLMEEVGETGCAHPLLMLSNCLDRCKGGEKIVVVGFGHGATALCFNVTPEVVNTKGTSVSLYLMDKKTTDNYMKFLAFRGELSLDMGLRAEASTTPPLSVLWRNRKMILGLVGGKCKKCGTIQYPKQRICVNPRCQEMDSQEEYEFSHLTGKILTYTGDMLASTIDPPHKYGIIEFEGGGRLLMDFTDCELKELKVGLPMEMVFRIRMEEKNHGLKHYFWKARPLSSKKKARQIDFKGMVAVITGAGGGLGRIYALELAKRGAKIVVNDLGGDIQGQGSSTIAAQKVVEEINEMGGEAIANFDDVSTLEGAKNIISSALQAFGKIDILINNAGIIRDKTLAKMDYNKWQKVIDVHLHGGYFVTRAALGHMKKQGYGRIVFTTSGAGLYGNFGQSNYSCAKLALIGLMNTICKETKGTNVKANAIAPIAASRLTKHVLPPELYTQMKPDYVAPLVLYLSSEECAFSGYIFNCALGYFSRALYIEEKIIRTKEKLTPEEIAHVLRRDI